ncbi:McrBC 5-methylcytosine restriction system component-like protein [Planktothrix agardhii CCAP 1459/11A]|uniref:McrBC 5-methylcytosine restriction system component-like protein n=1 Tax=Planktothrix agardhii CCAP 1459/11A TaxID=282420 RepID=A0A4V0XV70_PLAAG|nr:restriction endonuclease [Planktothrix agardhii]GDZ96309.1 McrBC 5-methylcytosine restriction system component-like protein [Planktothrix agardhii CCAP 1459/11A]
MKIIELIEYKTKSFKPEELEEAIADLIYHKYSKDYKYIEIEYPSPKTHKQYKLTAKSYIGFIPLTPDIQIFLKPKVPIANLFRMLEYTYDLKSFQILDGSVHCETIPEFYNRLANILTQKILAQSRKGFYRTYLKNTELLPYVRGKVDFKYQFKHPGTVKLNCEYNQYTADIEDNQILLWTLYIIGRSGLCSEQLSTTVRKAYHTLQGLATQRPFKGDNCLHRSYNRLNQDYQTLHSLCRFFLDNCGVAHQVGNYQMFPFLVRTDILYEKFVYAWLKSHLPANFEIKDQESVNFCKIVDSKIDLVIYDKNTKQVIFILDTKYKIPDSKPSNQDIYQAIAYATLKNSQNAILVYPKPLNQPLNGLFPNSSIRLQSLTFSLEDDLEQSGQRFLKALLNQYNN